MFYRGRGFPEGHFREAGRVDLKSLGEPQGEAVAFGASNIVYVAGEGGGKIPARNAGGAVMRELRPRPAMILVMVAALAAAVCSREVRNVAGHTRTAGVSPSYGRRPSRPRDLFHGPGGKDLLPRSTAFTFIAEDTTGFSPGFDVRDESGMEWSVKTGPEAQTEVVTSRILWAIGFHQPPTYYVEDWSLTGGLAGAQ